MSKVGEVVTEHRNLLPPIAGMAMAAAVSNLSIEQAHQATGISTFGGGTMVAVCAALAALFIATLRVKRFSKRFVSLGVFLSIHVGGLAALALAFAHAADAPLASGAVLLFQAVSALGATFLQFYWMRKLRGTSAQAVALVAFSALAASELLTFALGFASALVWNLACVALLFMQFVAVRASRSLAVPSDSFPAVSEGYFGTGEHQFSSRSFLVAAAIGIWLAAIPVGMGRGFFSGEEVPLDVPARIMALAAVCAVSAWWALRARSPQARPFATSVWVVIELLMGFAAVLFAVLPGYPAAGAALIMAAASVLQAFVWYMAVAFCSFGWRDPFYYASAAWVTMNLLSLAGMRFDALLAQALPEPAGAVIALMGLFVLVGAQVVFTRLLAAPSETDEAAAEPRRVTEDDVRRIPLMGVLAISPQIETPLPSKTPDVHIATAAIGLGRRFGLTGREVEVLTLYALGHTQARVSEELQLSTNTVHTYVKRIYEKTDLHSRQEILDYIAEYGG